MIKQIIFQFCTIINTSLNRFLCYVKSTKFKRIGKGVVFDPHSHFIRPETIEIGNNVYIGPNAHISSRNLKIGNGVMIGPNLLIENDDHVFTIIGKRLRATNSIRNIGKIEIKNDVWIGGNVTILKNVVIGTGTIIGANSLINQNLPPYSICVGTPCKPIKKRFNDEDLKKHLMILRYTENQIKDIIQHRNDFF
jgi:acetyltransferase-like isoleucine patch superfamily enzyme